MQLNASASLAQAARLFAGRPDDSHIRGRQMVNEQYGASSAGYR